MLDVSRIAVHARRLAEQDVERKVDDGRVGSRRVGDRESVDDQAALGRRVADDGERTALARAQRFEQREIGRAHAEHVAFLRFVAPDLHRRQMRIVARDRAQIDAAADVRIVEQFRNRVGKTARADIVDRHDRIFGAARPARVDDLLATALHFRVVALHRREVELFGARARRHRRCRATAEADQHRRAAEHDHRVAVGERLLLDVGLAQVRKSAGDHDRLVVAAAQARLAAFLLERAEVAAERGPAEFVVERRGADRSVAHDLERAREARRQRTILFPRPRKARNAQVRNREAGEAGLRLAAAAGRAFVADLAAGAGRCAGKRRDRGRMVVRLDLDRERRVFAVRRVAIAIRLGEETLRAVAFDDRRVVLVCRQRVRRRLRVRVADHREQRLVLLHAVDGEVRVEHLVPAVLGVRLREHHELGVGRIAAERRVACGEIFDFVRREREAEALVRLFERSAADCLRARRARAAPAHRFRTAHRCRRAMR